MGMRCCFLLAATLFWSATVGAAVTAQPRLAPFRSVARTPSRMGSGIVLRAELEVEVNRGEAGGLGVVVDQDNCVVSVSAQPLLSVGDVVLAVDGEALNSRPVAQVLTPGKPQYIFSIVRPSAAEASKSLERVLLELARDVFQRQGRGTPGVYCLSDDEELGARVDNVVASLEEAGRGCDGGAPTSVSALESSLAGGYFWRLLLTSEPAVAAGGLTGFGLAPYCSMLASFQLLKSMDEKEPTAQVVEVIANSMSGSSTVAALKGIWEGADAGTADAHAYAGAPAEHVAAVRETYARTEYSGAPLAEAETVVCAWACTYASERLRVCRAGAADGANGGAWRVYQRLPADKAQGEIGRLLAMPVAVSSERPSWAAQDAMRGYERPGGGPAPTADGGRM